MKKLSDDQKGKIKTVLELLAEETTTLDKMEKVGMLLVGINSKVDKKLEVFLKAVDKIKKVSEGEVMVLSAEKLPEKTEKDKKRKKLVLLLLTSIKDLKSEVGRVAMVGTPGNAQMTKIKAVKTAKILATLKGPLGVVTIAAVGIVAITSLINNKAVEVTIKNSGCRPIYPLTERAINLPGLKLPDKVIGSGEEGKAVLLPISFDVNILGSEVNLATLGFSRQYQMPVEIKEVVYDGVSLMGKSTKVELGRAKSHSLEIKCR